MTLNWAINKQDERVWIGFSQLILGSYEAGAFV
jgi:hypothetical protein